jgi:hypothetical protein
MDASALDVDPANFLQPKAEAVPSAMDQYAMPIPTVFDMKRCLRFRQLIETKPLEPIADLNVTTVSTRLRAEFAQDASIRLAVIRRAVWTNPGPGAQSMHCAAGMGPTAAVVFDVACDRPVDRSMLTGNTNGNTGDSYRWAFFDMASCQPQPSCFVQPFSFRHR